MSPAARRHRCGRGLAKEIGRCHSPSQLRPRHNCTSSHAPRAVAVHAAIRRGTCMLSTPPSDGQTTKPPWPVLRRMDRDELVSVLAESVEGVGEARAENVLDVLDAEGAFDTESDIDATAIREELEAGLSVVGDARRNDGIRMAHAEERFENVLATLPEE